MERKEKKEKILSFELVDGGHEGYYDEFLFDCCLFFREISSFFLQSLFLYQFHLDFHF